MSRILLIEDNVLARQRLCNQLQRREMNVIAVSSAVNWNDIPDLSKLDLVILNVPPPLERGLKVIRRLKKNGSFTRIPLIGLSVFRSPFARDECLKAGCDEFEAKPCDFPILFKKIQSCLDKSLIINMPVSQNRAIKGKILVVDDFEMNRVYLEKWLCIQGYQVALASDGESALKQVENGTFDLILLDMMMPGMTGLEVLARLKDKPQHRDIPVIMISAFQELDNVVKCIEMGAEDYLHKPFEPVLLRARIDAILEKKQLRDKERSIYLSLLESQESLAAELAEAAQYVMSLLPPPMSGEIFTDWRFFPSTQLGGDALGYYWLDADHFLVYVLDVRGHGVGAALLSISVMNLLRSQRLIAADLRDPSAVLGVLNQTFPMETQNDRFFTIWYGVYEKSSHTLRYANGGHPAPVLLSFAATDDSAIQRLHSDGVGIGILPDAKYPNHDCQVLPGSRLFLFSDGVFEISGKDGMIMTEDELIAQLAVELPPGKSVLDQVVNALKLWGGTDRFEDDFTLLQVDFMDNVAPTAPASEKSVVPG